MLSLLQYVNAITTSCKCCCVSNSDVLHVIPYAPPLCYDWSCPSSKLQSKIVYSLLPHVRLSPDPPNERWTEALGRGFAVYDQHPRHTWKDTYVWGLQPHLARAVALKYPTTIAQAAGHAEATELAIKASQRPGTGAQTGARSAGNFSGRGGSQVGPRTAVQVRGRTNAGQH